MLEFGDVTKRYGRWSRPALAEFALKVEPGQVVGLVGVNGAGKTTAIRIASGVILPTSGSVTVDGHDLGADKVRASKLIGWVPENPVHPLGIRLRTLMDYYAQMARVEPESETAKLLGKWGLQGYEKSRFRTLSMGLKKRFALAVSEIQYPRYFLLDEIFNGLDPVGAAMAKSWVADRRGAGCGLLISSHQLHAVQELSDRVAIVHKGRLLDLIDTKLIPMSGNQTLRIVLDRVDDTALSVLRRFGSVRTEGRFVIVTADRIDAIALGQAVENAGYAVKALEWTETDLEEYFLERIGRSA